MSTLDIIMFQNISKKKRNVHFSTAELAMYRECVHRAREEQQV